MAGNKRRAVWLDIKVFISTFPEFRKRGSHPIWRRIELESETRIPEMAWFLRQRFMADCCMGSRL